MIKYEFTWRLISGMLISAFYIFSIVVDSFWFVYYIPFAIAMWFAATILCLEFCKLCWQRLSIKLHRSMLLIFVSMYTGVAYLHLLYTHHLRPDFTPNLLWLENIYNYIVAPDIHFSFVLFLICFIGMLFCVRIVKAMIKDALTTAGLSILGFIYFSLGPVYLLLLIGEPDGIFYTFGIIYSTSWADILAYGMGKIFGKHKIDSAVSPNKSFEGYILGILFHNTVMIGSYFMFKYCGFRVPDYSIVTLILLNFMIFCLTMYGDMVASLWKRAMDAKDSGHTIPGHGGVIDLLDGYLVAVPISYHIIQFF